MRHLISSLQNHNLQLKGDVQRFKRKLRETQIEINKVDDSGRGGLLSNRLPIPGLKSQLILFWWKLRSLNSDAGALVLEESSGDAVDVKKDEDEDQEQEEEERRKELERQRAREREREAERDRERERERERQRSDELKRKDSDTLKMLRVELKYVPCCDPPNQVLLLCNAFWLCRPLGKLRSPRRR